MYKNDNSGRIGKGGGWGAHLFFSSPEPKAQGELL